MTENTIKQRLAPKMHSIGRDDWIKELIKLRECPYMSCRKIRENVDLSQSRIEHIKICPHQWNVCGECIPLFEKAEKHQKYHKWNKIKMPVLPQPEINNTNQINIPIMGQNISELDYDEVQHTPIYKRKGLLIIFLSLLMCLPSLISYCHNVPYSELLSILGLITPILIIYLWEDKSTFQRRDEKLYAFCLIFFTWFVCCAVMIPAAQLCNVTEKKLKSIAFMHKAIKHFIEMYNYLVYSCDSISTIDVTALGIVFSIVIIIHLIT